VIPGQDVAATALQALNNQEGLVGYYYARVATPDGGRLQKRGLFLWFDRYWDWTVPGTEETLLWDINDAFAVVGVARDVEGSAAVYRDPATGEWFEIVPPAPWIYIDVTSINNAGQLAGRMGADDPARPGFILWSGFLATPKPPEMLPQGQAVAQAQNLRGLSRSQPQVAQRPRLRLVADGCTEGHGEFVPLKLRAALGCDR